MKKFSLFFMAMFTLLVGSVLSACSFKKPEVAFKVGEIVLSQNESKNLDDLFDVSAAEKSEIDFLSSNTNLFEIDNKTLSAKETSGKGFLYAIYENNTLATLPVIVRKNFSAPENLRYDAGVLTWDAVQDKFDESSQTVNASSYEVSWTFSTDGENFAEDEKSPVTVSTNRFEFVDSSGENLAYGVYKISVSAVAKDYFDNGEASAEIVCGFNTMAPATNLVFNDGVLTWESTETSAQFDVLLVQENENITLASGLSAKQLDFSNLASSLQNLFEEAKDYHLRVVTSDTSSLHKLKSFSESLSIKKLQKVSAHFENGVLILPHVENAEKFVLNVTGQGDPQTFELQNESAGAQTFLETLSAGTYDISITSVGGANTMKSDAQVFEDVRKFAKLTLASDESDIFDDSFMVRAANIEGDQIAFVGLDQESVETDFAADGGEESFALTLANAKTYEVRAFQFNAQGNFLRSDESDSFVVTKVPDFTGSLTHRKDGEDSVFEFESSKFENDETFDIMFVGEEQDIDFEYENGQIKVLGGIEKYFETSQEETAKTVRVVASCNGNCVVSFIDLTLTKLAAPTGKAEDSSTDTFSWNATEKAESYVVKAYKIDKDTFDSGEFSSEDKEPVKTFDNISASQTEISLAELEVGYYAFVIVARGNTSSTLDSDALCKLFYKYTTLEVGNVSFGKGQFGESAPTYYVRVENDDENVSAFDFSIDKNANEEKTSEKGTTYVVNADFAMPKTISITAKNKTDSRLYQQSATYVLTVAKLAEISSQNIKFDKFGRKLNIDFEGLDNVSKVYVAKDSSNNANFYAAQQNEDFAVDSLSDLFQLSFDVFGSVINEDGTFAIEDGHVYLPSDTKTFDVSRLAQPQDLQYENGILKVAHTQIANTQSYVAVLQGINADGRNEGDEILFDFGNESVGITFNGETLTQSQNLKVATEKDVSLKVETVISWLQKEEPLFATQFSQFVSLKFSVYAICVPGISESALLISSRPASVFGGEGEWLNVLNFESGKYEISKFVMTQDEEGFKFSWDWGDESTAYADDVRFDFYRVGEEDDGKLNSQPFKDKTFKLAFKDASLAAGERQTFYVRAKNPHYIGETVSQNVVLHKLNGISGLALVGGELQFEIAADDFGNFEKIEFKIGETAKQLENSARTIKIEGANSYTLKLVGKEEEGTSGKIYHLDSEISLWTLVDMTTLLPQGDEANITITKDKISWAKFGVTQTNMEYVQMFKDEANTIKSITTQEEEILFSDTSLSERLSQLVGSITLQLAVHIKDSTEKIAPNNTIYFASENDELLDTEIADKFNYAVYSKTSNIKKLSIPTLKSLEFVGTEGNALSPTIKITLEKGNYEGTTNFNIYLNGDHILTASPVSATEQDGAYEININFEDFGSLVNAGENFTLDIYAVSDDATSPTLPSAIKTIDFKCAATFESLNFENDGVGFTSTLKLKFASGQEAYAHGGVYVVATIGEETEYISVDYDGTDDNEMTVSLAEFLNSHADGGTLTLSAFVRSDKNPVVEGAISRYVLASEISQELEVEVLPQLKSENVSVENGVLTVKDYAKDARIFVNANKQDFEMTKEGDNFVLVIPDDWVTGQDYDFAFVAKQSGSVNSASYTQSILLDRIDKVSNVKLLRGEDYAVSMTWEGNENAKDYRFEIFDENDQSLLNFETEKTSISLSELFGENYEKLDTLDLSKDQRLKFKIYAISKGGEGAGAFNSVAYTFGVTLKGNPLENNNFAVNEQGILTFEGSLNEKYVYSLLSTGIDGTQLRTWTEIIGESGKTKIDTEDVKGGETFVVKIFLSGSATKLDADIADVQDAEIQYEFVLDSFVFETSNSFVLEKLADITKIETNADTGEISFTLKDINTAERELFVGTDKDALMKGGENVLKIKATLKTNESEVGESENVWTYDFSKLLKELNLTANESLTLYFWAFAQVDEQIYISSSAKEYVLKVIEDAGLEKIEKLGTVTGNEKIPQNFIDTFAVFKGDEQDFSTLGIYIKVTATNGDVLLDKFIIADELKSSLFYQSENVYVLNLTQLFEDENLESFSGDFAVSFARLSKFSDQVVLSKWQDAEKTFTRLPAVSNVMLDEGNLKWNKTDSKQQVFYVYYLSSDKPIDSIPKDAQYTYFEIKNGATTFNASEHGIAGKDYYIAVCGINEDAYVLTSAPAFVGDPSIIRKNDIKTPLKLEDGRMVFDWTSSEFVKLITGNKSATEKLTELFETTFEEPFTFSLMQLVDNNIKIRLRFESISSHQSITYTLNVWDLLADLKIQFPEITQNIQSIIDSISDTAREEYLQGLITSIENSSNGIATQKLLFDERFEKLQEGGYSLTYYLVGNSLTLSSGMKSFSNENIVDDSGNAKNILYVNSQPNVNVVIEEKTDGVREFKVVFNKTQIYSSPDKKTVQKVYAKNYILRVGEIAFLVTIGGAGNGTLEQIGSHAKRSISIMQCNFKGALASGEEATHLMFFLNYNITETNLAGDSLLGNFEFPAEDLSFEIYAVGNGVSMSSKSEFFVLSALRFKQFYITEGEFAWTMQEERATMVYVQEEHDFATQEPEEIPSEPLESTDPQSEEKAQGRYVIDRVGDYTIRFVQFGEIAGNRIVVDSDIYMIEHAIKLSMPKLSSNFGKLHIDGSENFDTMVGQGSNYAFTTDSKFLYRISNDVADLSNLYMKYADNKQAVVDHEVGLTTYAFEGEVEQNLRTYLLTEEEATTFSVQMLGSTATFKAENDGENKFIKTLKCVDGPEAKKMPVAMRSNVRTENMAMFGAVHRLEISNGILTWLKVENRNEQFTISEQYKTVYRVVVDAYTLTYNSESQQPDTQTKIDGFDTIVVYTANNSFDFTKIDLPNVENLYLKVNVQAFAAQITKEAGHTSSQPLIEGGYVYDSAVYETEKQTYVLMGNGSVIEDIRRLNPVDSVTVNPDNGRLTWQYSIEDVDESTFLSLFSFVVEDDDGKEISGRYEVTNIGENLYQVTFAEDKGQMKTGQFEVTIYATQGAENRDKVIKSFGVPQEVVKLASINSATDFVVETSSDNAYEILDFSTYYQTPENLKNSIRVSAGSRMVTVTNAKHKIKILAQDEEEALPEDFAGSLVITSQMDLMFVVVDEEGSIYSDESDFVTLTRSGWGDTEIVWDSEKQTFSWDYTTRTVMKNVKAQPRKLAFVTTSQTNYYNSKVDALTGRNSQGVLQANTVFETAVFDGDVAIIDYQGQTYYIRSELLQRRLVEDTSAAQIDIDQRTKFDVYLDENGEMIVENGNTLISYQGKLYLIPTAQISVPTFVITATYRLSSGDSVRTYTTTESEFMPTIICSQEGEGVSISVRVKLNNISIQSGELTYRYGEPVQFDLFASGNGSQEQPYIISDVNQFKNIAYRMQKPSNLNNYVSGGQQTKDSQQVFYFKLGDKEPVTLSLTEQDSVAGILFPGVFAGRIDGNNSQINFTSTGVSRINQISVNAGNYTTSTNRITFNYASSLFEELAGSANIQNLDLSVTFMGEKAVQVSNNSILTALAVVNHGKIENVDVVGFANTNFYAGSSSSGGSVILAFAGLVGTNISSSSVATAQITKCNLVAAVNIVGNVGSVGQATFVGGIAVSNSAKISECNATGSSIAVTCQARNDFVQIGGIVVNNANGGSLESCTNSANITVIANLTENSIRAYVGGICARQDGTVSGVKNTGLVVCDDRISFSLINNVGNE